MLNKSVSKSSTKELDNRKVFEQLVKDCPIPKEDLVWNYHLFVNRQTFGRQLFFQEMYQHIVGIHGVIMEFGVYYGRDLAMLINLRGTYEGKGYTRKIIGFDTFGEGIPEIDVKDGDKANKGDFSVPEGYDVYLEQLLQYHERECDIPQYKKFELVKGNVIETLPKYLEKHQETIIALAYFDMDVYKPTIECLKILQPYFAKGCVIGFDDLNFEAYPGETIAVKEWFGLNNIKLRRIPHDPVSSYAIFGE